MRLCTVSREIPLWAAAVRMGVGDVFVLMFSLFMQQATATPLASMSSLAWDSGNVLRAGVLAHLTATLLDDTGNAPPVDKSMSDYGNYLSFSYADSSGHAITGTTPTVQLIKVTTTGIQQMTMNWTKLGTYSLLMDVSGEAILGSPFQFYVTPGPVHYPSSYGAWLNGAYSFSIDSLATLVVYLVDAFGNNITSGGDSRFVGLHLNNLAIGFNGATDYTGTVFQQTFGQGNTELITFKTQLAGTLQLQVGSAAVQTEFLSNSPFSLSITVGPISVGNSLGYWSPDKVPAVQAGKQAQFVVSQRDKYGNIVCPATGSKEILKLTGSVYGEPGLVFSTKINTTTSETTYMFTLFHAQKYSFSLQDSLGSVLDGLPQDLMVVPGEISYRACSASFILERATASGVPLFSAGLLARVQIHLMDAYGNEVSAVNGATTFNADFNNVTLSNGVSGIITSLTRELADGSGYQILTFVPLKAGTTVFQLHIGHGTEEVISSPLSFLISVGDMSPSSCIASWLHGGSQSGKVGQAVTARVYIMDCCGNNLTAATGFHLYPQFVVALDATEQSNSDTYLTGIDGSIISTIGDGFADITFVPVFAGVANVHVYIVSYSASTEVKNSPLSISLQAGNVVMQMSYAYWPISQTFVAGSTALLAVMQLDQYENVVCTETFRSDTASFNGTVYYQPPLSTSTSLGGVKVSVAGPKSGSYNATWVLTKASAGYSVTITGLVQAGTEIATYYPIQAETDLTFSILPSTPDVKYCVVRHGSIFGDPLPITCPMKSVYAGFIDDILLELRDSYSNMIASVEDTTDPDTFSNFTLAAFNGSTDITAKVLSSVENIPNPDGSSLQAINFLPILLGLFNLRITGAKGESPICGAMQLKILAGALSVSHCVGSWQSDLNTAQAGGTLTLMVLLRDIYNNSFKADFRDTEGMVWNSNFRFNVVKILTIQGSISNVLQSEVDPDGFSPIAFSPTQAGRLQLEVGNNGEDPNSTGVIIGSPFNFTVTAGDAFLQNCLGSWVRGTNTFQAGTKIIFQVLMKDAFGNIINSDNGASDFLTLTMSVLFGASGKLIPYYKSTNSKDKATGYQYLSFEMQMMGQFLLQVVSGSENIMGSPFAFNIVVGSPMVARCTGSWLSQVNTFQAGSIATLNVQLTDSFGNAVTQANGGIPLFMFTVAVVGQASMDAVLANLTQLPGQQITFVPLKAGSFQLRVASKDSIIGSPFSFTVLPGPLSIPSCIATWKNDINDFTAGQYANVSVLLMDFAGNTLSTFTGQPDSYNFQVRHDLADLNAIQDVKVSTAQSGYIYISFITSVAAQGILLRVGTMVGSSWQFEVSNSPLMFNVKPGPAQAPWSTGAWRSAMNQYQRPALVQFLITQRDAAGNPVYTKKGQPPLALQATLTVVNSRRTVAIVDRSWTLFPDQPSSCLQLLTFRPSEDGSFILSVFDSSGAILGGPFLMWYFPGNVAPSMCTLTGPGLSSSTAGDHSSFLVQLNDANGIPPQAFTQLSTIGGLTAVLLMRNSTYELSISIASDPDSASGALYTCSYTAYIAGTYDILVYYAGLLLKSGLTKTVSPGLLDAAYSTAQGPALRSPQQPGSSLMFNIYVYDSQGNNVPYSIIQVILVPVDGTNVTSIDIDAVGVAKVTMTVTKAPQTYLVNVLVAPNTAYPSTATDEIGTPVMLETSIFQQNVSGSPYAMQVHAGTPNASLSSASGNGLNAHASWNEWGPIIVTLLDGYKNPATGYTSLLALSITGAGNFESSGFQDQGNGQYISEFKPLELGSYQIAISLKGAALPGSPWSTTVVDIQLPQAANDTASTLDGLPVSIEVTANDKVFFGTVTITAVPMVPINGYVTITKNKLLYTPNYQFYGTDVMSYTIKDGYNRTDTAFVLVDTDIRPPHFVSLPSVLAAFEGIPMPSYGGIDGISIAYNRPDAVIYAQVSSNNGDIYQETQVSDGTLSLTGTVVAINSSLQNLHYIGNTYFNGNDTITLKLSDEQGNSDTRMVMVMVQAINDPPFISAPTILEVRSIWVNFGGAYIPGIVVGDPDDADVRGNKQLTGGLLKASVPFLYRRDIALLGKSDSIWKNRPEDPDDEDPVSVKGLGIQFTAPLDVCNSILSQLMFAKDDLNISVRSVNLMVSVNDMGEFGCYETCDSNKTVPLIATMTIELELLDWLTKLENLWAETLRATRRILGSTGGSVGAAFLVLLAIMVHLGRKAHAQHKAARAVDAEELNQELLCEQSRIFNPMWIPSAAGDLYFRVSSTPNPLIVQLRKVEFRKRLSKVSKEIERQALSGFKRTPTAVDEMSNPLISQLNRSNSGDTAPRGARMDW